MFVVLCHLHVNVYKISFPDCPWFCFYDDELQTLVSARTVYQSCAVEAINKN